MTDNLVLYTHPMSRGRIARWMLEEVGEPYTATIVDYGPAMKSPEYLAINPMGKVPALRHGDTIVTECAAICAYLADAFPAAGLAPSPEDRGAYYRWLFFAAGPLESATMNKALGFEAPADKKGMTGYGSIEDVLAAVEGLLEANRYVTGDTFSAADVYLGSHIGWGLQFGTIDKRPAFERYTNLLNERPAWKKTMATDDALMAEHPAPSQES